MITCSFEQTKILLYSFKYFNSKTPLHKVQCKFEKLGDFSIKKMNN